MRILGTALAVMAIYCLAYALALADVWYSCEAITEFCRNRPYHRDCNPKTMHGLPLVITVECEKPPSDFEECRKHPYNMFCTQATKEWCSKPCPE